MKALITIIDDNEKVIGKNYILDPIEEVTVSEPPYQLPIKKAEFKFVFVQMGDFKDLEGFKMTDEERNKLWMFAFLYDDVIKEKTEQWTKEAEKAGMTLTEYLESISPLNHKEDQNESNATMDEVYKK